MANYPFKHWYAIVDGGCWYVGYHINREDATAQAIRTCNVHHSKAGYVVVDRQVLQIIANDINDTLSKDKETPDKKQISNKKQTFKYSEWKTRLELHGEDVVDFLSISEDEELAYANGQELPPLVLIACRFLERCHLLALDQLENVIIKQKGEPFIKAHYPTLAVANGAFQQYALSYFYNEQRYYKKNLKRLFHTLSGVEKEYRKEYKKRSAT